ncbi:YVTN repeat-like/Quino protein amine dehydrogenase [Sarocladium strictum]
MNYASTASISGTEGMRMSLSLLHQRSCSRTEITSLGASPSSSVSSPVSIYAIYQGTSPTVSWIDVFDLRSGAALAKLSGSGASFAPTAPGSSQKRLAALKDWAAPIGKAGEEVRYGSSVLVRDVMANGGGKTLLEVKSVERGPVAWSSDARMIAAIEGDEGSRVGVWDARTGERRGRVMGHSERVTHLAFTPAGKLVSLGRDGVVRITNVNSGRTDGRLVLPIGGGAAKLLELSEDGGTITTVWGRGSVYVWNPAAGSVDSYEMDAKRATEGWALTGGANGRYLVSRTEDGFDVMDLRSGEVVGEVKRAEEDNIVYTAATWVTGAGWSDQGVVVMGRMDGVVEVWEVRMKM